MAPGSALHPHPPASPSPPGSSALILQKGEIRVINQTTCESLLPQQITPRMMCVGYLSGGVDACQVREGRGRAWGRGLGGQGAGPGAGRAFIRPWSPRRAIPGALCPAWRPTGGSSRPAW